MISTQEQLRICIQKFDQAQTQIRDAQKDIKSHHTLINNQIRNEFQVLTQVLNARMGQLQAESKKIEEDKLSKLREQSNYIRDAKDRALKLLEFEDTSTNTPLVEQIINDPRAQELSITASPTFLIETTTFKDMIPTLGSITYNQEPTIVKFTFNSQLNEQSSLVPPIDTKLKRSITSPSVQTQLERLIYFRNKKIISEEEFRRKRALILKQVISPRTVKELANDVKTPDSSGTSNHATTITAFDQQPPPKNLTQQHKSLLAKILHLKHKNVITDAEYEQKKNQIYMEANQRQLEDGKPIDVYLYNMPASRKKPLRVVLNDTDCIVRRRKEIPVSVTDRVHVQSEIPKDENKIKFEVHIDAVKKNVTREFVADEGTFFVICMDDGRQCINIEQSKSASPVVVIENVRQQQRISSPDVNTKKLSELDMKRLNDLKVLKEKGVITPDDFDKKKSNILFAAC